MARCASHQYLYSSVLIELTIGNYVEETSKRLEELVLSHANIGEKILKLHKVVPAFQFLHSDTEELTKIVTYTSCLAENISRKVKQLDLAKSLVAGSLRRVEDIMDLRACTEGVKTALHDEDFEQAAAHVHRFLGLDQRGLRSCVGDEMVEGTSLEEAFSALTAAQGTLIDIVTQRFNEALSRSDQASIERFFKIFPLLNQQHEGLTKYSNYLCRQVTDNACRSLRIAQSMSKSDKRYAVALADSFSELFEDAARLIEIHQPLVERYYGHGELYVLVEILHREVCVQQRRIFQELLSSRVLARRCKKAQDTLIKGSLTDRSSTGLRGNSSSGNLYATQDPLIETKEVDAILEELALIHKHAELYFRFIKRRVNDDLEQSKLSPEVKASRITELNQKVAACELNKDMQELMSYYICLEEFFMVESVKKAVELESFEESSPTSSLLDDVFFLLKKCLRRAFSTASADGACAMLNHSGSLIEGEFARASQERLQRGFPTGAMMDHAINIMQGKLQSQAEQERDREQFVVTLNNLDTACDYVDTLVTALTAECPKRFPGCSAQERGKLEACLANVGAAGARLRSLSSAGIGQLCASAVRPHIKAACDAFHTANHQLSEAEFAQLEADDGLRPFIQQLVMNLDSLLNSFREVLTAKNHEQLVALVASEITQLLEKAALKTIYNRLGGMQLDKELRYLIGYLTKVASWSIRDRFSKLTQISLLLNIDSISEVEEICSANQSSLTWRLTPAEVRQALGLRTEFKSDEIKKLHL
ncbi:conserved oligomeric Golgi complex subunit 4-like isoform X1 [Varroa jacobsoni]|uniref:conserved oligomeric Golgi complex subunit 4-like isoform X1 n=1 Tax=Varroa jacobsoni TaxID=62625 RepID=UPI000BFA91D1|nr:conserved oligomeric Golgi complex subunit 4-like isoform X1 [Varroa jacobsoni]